MHGVHCWSRVQRLVAETVYVERETALVVGSDNACSLVILYRSHKSSTSAHCA